MSKWIELETDASTGKPYLWKCDECGEEVETKWNYCPECGDPKTGKAKSINTLVKALETEHRKLKEMQSKLGTNLAEVGTDCISRQAAIDILRQMPLVEVMHDVMLIDKAEAMTELMLLPSAQPEPCEDAVSRLEIIRNLHKYFKEGFEQDKWWNSGHVIHAIMDAPSVTPKQRTGKWIDVDVMGMPAQACDQCKTFFPLAYTGGGHHYCPNCGAKMEGEQDG